jgi:hypothetical protein
MPANLERTTEPSGAALSLPPVEKLLSRVVEVGCAAGSRLPAEVCGTTMQER